MNDETLFCGAIIYLLALQGFLIPLKWIPPGWRWVILAFFCTINIGLSFIYRGVHYLTFNIQSGEYALNFFTGLSEQLANNSVNVEYIPMPSYTTSIILGIVSLAVVIAGFVIIGMKVRWYSWLSVIAVLVFSFGILDIQTPHVEERYIKDSNQLREKTYSLIEQKRKENVSYKQIFDAIKANLKDFRYTYENRKDERESSEKILTAIEKLKPENNAECTEQ